MIEMKITGDTPAKFFENAMNTMTLMATAGTGKPMQPIPQDQVAAHIAGQLAGQVEHHEDVLSDGLKKPEPKPAESKSTTKRLATQKKSAAPAADAFPVSDKVGTLPVKYTMDQVRARVMQINEAHSARVGPQAKTQAEKDLVQDACVTYVLDLFEQFDIKQARELPVARFNEFMDVSQGYLDGSVVVE